VNVNRAGSDKMLPLYWPPQAVEFPYALFTGCVILIAEQVSQKTSTVTQYPYSNTTCSDVIMTMIGGCDK